MTSDNPVVWRFPLSFWISVVVVSATAGVVFYDGLEWMVMTWARKEEYSHGFLIPAITLFLIWQKKDRLERMSSDGSWTGFAVVLMGIAAFILGELSTLYVIIQYSFIIVLVGLVLSVVGWRGIREIWVPLAFLIFMIPFPDFIYQGFSAQLQLVSSQLGVVLIRLFGISVYLEGNVIDLGSYKLRLWRRVVASGTSSRSPAWLSYRLTFSRLPCGSVLSFSSPAFPLPYS